MRLTASLRACLLAILVTQVAANGLFPRQSSAPADPPVTPDPPTPTPPTSSSTSSTPTSTSSTPTSTSSTRDPEVTPSSSNTPPPSDPTPTPPPGGASSLDPVIVSGDEITQTETVTNTSRSSGRSSSATPAPSKDSEKKEDEGIGTGPIVGMSVAGGLAVLGIIAFFVWKFTRKRFSTFDDSEPIKWPELNSHGGAPDSHPLPVRDTGRAGFGDTGSESDLSRINTANYSTTDFAGGHDPYAVPPLPHLNPNQPYRDDPTATTGYYDPYRGPVPGTVETGQNWEGEAIPMNQMHGGGYEQQQLYGAGRQSPGPLQAYDTGRGSPAPPNMGYQQPAFDQYDQGRQSPAAFAGGRASPGPNAALGAAPGYVQQPAGYR